MGHTPGKLKKHAVPGTPAREPGSSPNPQGLAEVRSVHQHPTLDPRAHLLQNHSLHRWFPLPSPVSSTKGFANFNPYQSTP